MIIWILKGMALAVALGLLLLAILSARAIQRHDIRLLGVQTGSMKPAINTGDAVIVRKVNPDTLLVGDIITYRTAESGSMTTHRIHEMSFDKKQLVTKGDANGWPDGALPSSHIVGEAIAVAPYAGKIADTIRSPAGLIAFLYLPATALFLYEAHRLQQNLRRPYRLQR